MSKKWRDTGIQALICPAYPSCAFKTENADDLSTFADYAFTWSFFKYCSGVVPVTEVLVGEDQEYEDGYNDDWTKSIRKDIKGSVGMPVGVQVVSYQWEDETCLGVMKALDDKINYRKSFNM
jgi:Asp-tRNA(Asn)/Glu-tRNA(Gln) amidotransferase A subunit family amidase